MEPYYGPDGTLYIWTGTGYHAIPKIAASDVGVVKPGEELWNQGDTNYTSLGMTPDAYGITNMDPYSSLSGLHAWNQFSLQDGTQDAFNYWLKSGDKEGSQITFQRDGDYYNPTFAGLQSWDTNDADKRVIPLSILIGGGGLLAAGAAGAGAAAGAAGAGGSATAPMTTWGVLDTSLALPGTTFAAGGAGAAGAAAGATPGQMTTWGALDTSMALPGTTFVDGMAGAGSAGLLGQAGEYLLKNPNLLKGGATLLGGLLGSATEGDSGSGSPGDPYANIQPVPTPQMYGGNAQVPQFQAQGDTETERRMMQQYLPSLFRQGLLGNMAPSAQRQQPGMTAPPIRSLLGY